MKTWLAVAAFASAAFVGYMPERAHGGAVEAAVAQCIQGWQDQPGASLRIFVGEHGSVQCEMSNPPEDSPAERSWRDRSRRTIELWD